MNEGPVIVLVSTPIERVANAPSEKCEFDGVESECLPSVSIV